MLEALRLTVSGIINEVQGIKTTQSGLLERIVTMEARLQNALVGVNKNFVLISNDIEVQCNVINKLVGTMNQWEQEQKVLTWMISTPAIAIRYDIQHSLNFFSLSSVDHYVD